MRPLRIHIFIALVCLTLPLHALAADPQVELQTSMGAIVIELNPSAAPKTVENFLSYVKSGFYDNTIFHRVIKSFMIQGGGLSQDMQKKKTQPPISNEADNGLKNTLGTVAMARTGDPNSATAQFFINVKDNPFLDHKSKTQRGWGYCVFGKVTQGMEIIRKIEAVQTGVKNRRRDVPLEPVIISKASVVPTEQKKK